MCQIYGKDFMKSVKKFAYRVEFKEDGGMCDRETDGA